MTRLPGVLLIMAMLVLVTPAAVFVIAGLASGMGPAAIMGALVTQFGAPRVNLAVVSVLGLAPLVLLSLILWIGRRFGRFHESGVAVSLGGAVAVLILAVFVNFQYWPTFLPSQNYPGWPHGIEFVVGPLFGGPIAVLVGMVVGLVAARR